jgi:hypothetical protein
MIQYLQLPRIFHKIGEAFEEIKMMKRMFGLALACILLSVSALAAGNSQKVKFPAAVQVGSTQLPAGDYKVTWTGTGSSVQVTLAQKGIASVTVPAKAVQQKNNHVGISTDTKNGKEVLQVILLSNVKLIL